MRHPVSLPESHSNPSIDPPYEKKADENDEDTAPFPEVTESPAQLSGFQDALGPSHGSPGDQNQSAMPQRIEKF